MPQRFRRHHGLIMCPAGTIPALRLMADGRTDIAIDACTIARHMTPDARHDIPARAIHGKVLRAFALPGPADRDGA